jgi:hypothetical protein
MDSPVYRSARAVLRPSSRSGSTSSSSADAIRTRLARVRLSRLEAETTGAKMEPKIHWRYGCVRWFSPRSPSPTPRAR